jgi:alpha-beta hydrolase superfamily lysophospholipase
MTLTHCARFVSRPLGVYFDELTPTGAGPRGTGVMVHGGSHTGSCYLLTADGRRAEEGYRVLVLDWPGHGRGGTLEATETTMRSGSDSATSSSRF